MDQLLLLLADALERVAFEFSKRSLAVWLLSFAPVILFLEIPRYYLPLFGLMLAHRLGRTRDDEGDRERMLAEAPLVSVVIAGLNEAETIEAAIESLLSQNWPNLEIIVVDDHSSDEMFAKASRYARRGQVRVLRNGSKRGRLGKPAGINLGVRVSNGEYVIVVDADTTFDRRMIEYLIAPFADDEVGVVAGNVHVRNAEANLLTRLQTIEYAISIDLHKRWTDLFGCTLQGSGAITAFRRRGLMEIQGYMQELAEDTDISLRMVKAGYRLVFAPRAVAITNVPERLAVLSRQRARWDRGGIRTFYKKHWRLMRPSVAGWSFASELWSEFFYAVVVTLAYPFYFVWMLLFAPWALFAVLTVSTLINIVLSLFSLHAIDRVCERILSPYSYVGAAVVTPFYKGLMRWVRFKATVLELLRIRYDDSFLPQSAWAHAPRW